MDEGRWPRFAVLGAGAVGSYFGGMLARAGAPVTFIGRTNQVAALTTNGLTIDSIHFRERLSVVASSDVAAAGNADFVLLSVKTVDTESAAQSIAPALKRGALVVSLQNGVDNVVRIHAASGIEALAAVVYVAAEITDHGTVKHVGRGDLIVGELLANPSNPAERKSQLARLAAQFTGAGVPCKVSDRIETELWTKMLLNCAYNAVSALARTRYGRIADDEGSREIIRQVIDEATAVAHAAGVRLADRDLFAAALQLGPAMSNAFSSTAQDIARGKRTEIDSLNGYLARRGRELGVETPVNRTLHALVKLLEAAG